MTRAVLATLVVLAMTGLDRAAVVPVPDFSGVWITRGTVDLLAPQATDDRSRPARSAGLDPSFGPKFTVRQTKEELTIERDVRNGHFLTTVYFLSGKPSKNLEPLEEMTSTAIWKKDRLEIVTRDSTQRELRRVLWLETDGRLTVETIKEGQHYNTIYGRSQ